MSATLIGNNVTQKINTTAVNTTRSSNGTIYTAPATGFAIVFIYGLASSNYTLQYAGNTINTVSAAGLIYQTFYVAPSTALSLTGHTAGSILVIGTEFLNSP